jgi:hypothetical protein
LAKPFPGTVAQGVVLVFAMEFSGILSIGLLELLRRLFMSTVAATVPVGLVIGATARSAPANPLPVKFE